MPKPAAKNRKGTQTEESKSTAHVWMNIDIDGDLAAYTRAVDFVKACDIKYNLKSNILSELGGSEKARLEEIYMADWEWSQKGRMLVELPPQRIEIELFHKDAPKACENFKALVTGEKGKGKQSGKPLHYKGCRFHRIVPGFIAQTGDIVKGTGTGGESIWGKKFKDDLGGLKLKHDSAGIVACCNQGKNSNTSQFFITFAPQKKLDGKHVVFGRIVKGMEVIAALEQCGDKGGEPSKEAIIVDCGLL